MAIRHEKVLDSIMQMIEHLTDTMPRFETYLNLYPTPALRKAMRAIYDDMIDFILTSVIFLSRRRYGITSQPQIIRYKNLRLMDSQITCSVCFGQSLTKIMTI